MTMSLQTFLSSIFKALQKNATTSSTFVSAPLFFKKSRVRNKATLQASHFKSSASWMFGMAGAPHSSRPYRCSLRVAAAARRDGSPAHLAVALATERSVQATKINKTSCWPAIPLHFLC
mmetsp:Transcript_7707/g.19461  ORF Transcript_7707/g.19461 Transcript_7707/m.19461 type:complete len:119 (+) Transcript_7707:3277-3633(+)